MEKNNGSANTEVNNSSEITPYVDRFFVPVMEKESASMGAVQGSSPEHVDEESLLTLANGAFGDPEEVMLEQCEELEGKEEMNGDESSEPEETHPAPTLPVKEIVNEINEIAKGTVDHGKMRIGEYVLDNVFAANIQLVLTKSPRKSRSLRAICEDRDLLVDHRRLGQWVKAAALRRDLEISGVEIAKLGFAQISALLLVENKDERVALAKRVAQESLSVRQIRDAANTGKPKNLKQDQGAQILKKLSDPLSLLENEKDKDFLLDKERLVRELSSESRLRLIGQLDRRFAKIIEYKDFLAETKKTLLAIQLAELNAPYK